MTEIRRSEVTPQLATDLFDAYRRCEGSVKVGGGRIVPVTFEDTFNAAIEAKERFPSEVTGAYMSLCRWARFVGFGGTMRNAPDVGPEYVSTPGRYFIDDRQHYDTYLELKREMEGHLGRKMRHHERPLLMDRPVVLTMRAGEEADKVLAALERDGEIMIPRLVGRGLAAALQPVYDDPHASLSYHR